MEQKSSHLRSFEPHQWFFLASPWNSKLVMVLGGEGKRPEMRKEDSKAGVRRAEGLKTQASKFINGTVLLFLKQRVKNVRW